MLRRLLVFAGASALAAALSAPMAAQAYPHCNSGYNCDYVWFADTAHTQPVGWLLIECDGSSSSAGVRTAQLEYRLSRCNT
jgi:hypothetical protein